MKEENRGSEDNVGGVGKRTHFLRNDLTEVS